jgi:phosphopantothenoylcysteine decarboxylase/phosphopantothenate--cysteine ligase
MAALTPDQPLSGKHVLLAVTGSVAACKADRVLRLCQEAGAEVRVLITDAGRQFFTPDTAGALTDGPVYTSAFDPDEPGRMPHIELKRWSDLVLVAPATANRLLQLDDPEASDLLSTVIHAFDGPTLYAPAMNPDMWDSPDIQSTLEDHSRRIILPGTGEMACGDVGPGRFPDPARIVERVIERVTPSLLSDQRWIVTAGPTREKWDDIRFLSNRSSGRMGASIARVGSWLGAEVELVTGTRCRHFPQASFALETVESTEGMLDAVLERMDEESGYVGAAAVSDYRPRRTDGKISSGRENLTIELDNNPDIIRELRSEFPDVPIVGFSADDAEGPEKAIEKARDKEMDAVVFNALRQANGAMESTHNRVNFCLPGGEIHPFGHRSKMDAAGQIWLAIRSHVLST